MNHYFCEFLSEMRASFLQSGWETLVTSSLSWRITMDVNRLKTLRIPVVTIFPPGTYYCAMEPNLCVMHIESGWIEDPLWGNSQ